MSREKSTRVEVQITLEVANENDVDKILWKFQGLKREIEEHGETSMIFHMESNWRETWNQPEPSSQLIDFELDDSKPEAPSDG